MSTEQIARGPLLDPSFVGNLHRRESRSFRHDMVGHPLLGIDEIADLASDLPEESITAAEAVQPLVVGENSTHRLAVDVVASRIRDLATSDSWFTLLNIEQVERYRILVNEILDSIAEATGLPAKDVRRRMGFVFASSPNSVTPSHIDPEHSLMMQLEGHRKISFGRFSSPAAEARELSRFWDGSYGGLSELPEETHSYDLSPGVGAYIPPYVPHWVTNTDNRSLSLTVTFLDRGAARQAQVESFNARLRGRGLKPKAYGTTPARDRATSLLLNGVNRLRKRDGEGAVSA